jgi:hypothetical protein
MNYLLTILRTPIEDNEFIVGFNRFMSPIVETDGRYVQYSNGLLLYHFDTKLDQLGVSDHIRELMDSFGVFVILTEINSNTVFGIEGEHVDGLLNLGPDISIKNFPYVIYPKDEEPDTDDDTDEVVQKLMQKFRVKEIEPTLDEVLEKIHAKGVSSLSIQEQAVLNQFK